ncbi:cell division protein FtsQ/DivIB [Natronospira bacteriovora]|uniref:Cell division protein FtsQ n=1 Tax=Natronospira bacteriovora TaxID=3069753 RepID=A0ABU0W6E6_9GAMM|nr:cell division protein FtsQ/DivIB [Natronospira sp. AB-CW4]MDQ2069503.1 cell division protein FtsQ/DivIB [Natronospira sp. AB-CW4]
MSQARRRQSERQWQPPAWLLPVSGGLVLVAVITASALHWLPRLEGPAFETLVIKGERRQLTAEALRDRVRPALLPGYFAADLGALRESLEAEPWVASVSVRRQWPSTLELTVHEQVPVAVWNRSGFLNEAGEFFVPREIHRQPGFLPELSGPEGSEAEVLSAWRDMRRTLAVQELEIAELSLSDRRAWTVTLEAGPVVNLGRSDHEARFRRFVQIALPALQQARQLDFAALEYIDMRYTNGFSVARASEGRASDREDRGNG